MASKTSGEQHTGGFHEIPRDRCEELLAAQTHGRVAFNAADGPELLPVTYALYNKMIVFRTSPYGVLSQLSNRTNVAFEVDQVDHERSTGWSVVVRGSAQGIVEPYDLVKLWTMDTIVPWASGTRNVFIAITPRTVTGRTVQAPFAG